MAARTITFTVQDQRLQRHVRLGSGRKYQQACSFEVFQQVVEYVEEHAEHALSSQGLWRARPDLPFTQIYVALDFLAEYQLVIRQGKKLYLKSPCLNEEAMEHFYFLAQGTSTF